MYSLVQCPVANTFLSKLLYHQSDWNPPNTCMIRLGHSFFSRNSLIKVLNLKLISLIVSGLFYAWLETFVFMQWCLSEAASCPTWRNVPLSSSHDALVVCSSPTSARTLSLLKLPITMLQEIPPFV